MILYPFRLGQSSAKSIPVFVNRTSYSVNPNNTKSTSVSYDLRSFLYLTPPKPSCDYGAEQSHPSG